VADFGYPLTREALQREPEHVVKLGPPQDLYKLFRSIAEENEYCFLLESVTGPRKLSEYSFIGFEPYAVLRVKDGLFTVEEAETGDRYEVEVSDPNDVLRRLILSKRPKAQFRFMGGAVGYISYDAIRYWEKIPDLGRKASGFPDMEFGIYSKGVVVDHRMNEAYYFSDRDESPDSELLEGQGQDGSKFSVGDVRCNMTREGFEEAVLRGKDYIASGDIFQVVLSKRYDMRFDGDILSFYESLRKINPSPYMYFLKMGERSIVGSSPEMLFRVTGSRVETFPIAGTRPMKGTEEDERLAADLLADEKERAEHVMLVDLARNDLGRVCRYGTVSVNSFMEIHRFSHVQHIVSHVVGELRLDNDCFDVLKAMFPAGTVTGAPKVRAMEIIEELESDRRGPYAGCLGYFSFNGNADFAITIRTLVMSGNTASVQAGAGIVADSDPSREWMETEHKTGALLKAMGR